MKTLMVTLPAPYKYIKGSSFRIDMMVKNISKFSDLTVITHWKGETPKYKNVNIIRIPEMKYRLFSMLLIWAYATREILKGGYNIIQAEDIEAGIFCIALKYLSGKKLIYSSHGSTSLNLRYRFYPLASIGYIAEKLVYVHSDLILANYKATKKRVPRNKKCYVIEDFVDSLECKFVPNLPKEYCCYVGNFNKYQGTDDMIEAFSKYRTTEDKHLVIVGSCDKKRVKNIHYLGRLSDKETNFVVSNAKLALLPRKIKIPAMKMILYAQHGIPIVAYSDMENEVGAFFKTGLYSAWFAIGISEAYEFKESYMEKKKESMELAKKLSKMEIDKLLNKYYEELLYNE